MNKFTAKKIALITLLSVVLSFAIIRWHSVENVPFCHYSAGCAADANPKGDIKVTTYGYPLAYRQVEKFNPKNSNESAPNYAGFAEAKVEDPNFSPASAIANIIFWFALLHLLSGIIRPRGKLTPNKTVETPDSKLPAM